MLKRRIEDHLKWFMVLLLLLAAFNAGAAYETFPDHPIMAIANGAMAALIILGVILTLGGK
jgi:hypothetical protein